MQVAAFLLNAVTEAVHIDKDVVRGFLYEEANGISLTRRELESRLRNRLGEIYDTHDEDWKNWSDAHLRRSGLPPFSQFERHVVRRVARSALVPFLLAQVPRIVEGIDSPWESPRSSVQTTIEALETVELEIVKFDWPSLAAQLNINRGPTIFAPLHVEHFSDAAFREILLPGKAELRKFVEDFFYSDLKDLVAPGAVGESEGTALSNIRKLRRDAIDAYIEEVKRKTGERITKTMIWEKAGYKDRRQFEGWQRGKAKHGSAVDTAIQRVLRDKPHLKSKG